MNQDQKHEKSARIQGMFNDISHRYDLLNYLLSAGRDRSWRKRAIKMLNPAEGSSLLDLACGTGDVALTAIRLFPKIGAVLGLDFSENMLTLARKKFEEKGIAVPYEFKFGDATELPVDDNSYDNLTIAFGIRNVVDVPIALSEVQRILKPGGKFLILEFSPPEGKVFGPLFHFYFNRVLPKIGGLISGKPEAYSYLPKSVGEFYSREKLCELIENAGMRVLKVKPYTFGVTIAYLAQKSE